MRQQMSCLRNAVMEIEEKNACNVRASKDRCNLCQKASRSSNEQGKYFKGGTERLTE